jgi:2-polyprenyl-6-methoxyphenol hydroxylase-like FAD-dependent oxidoreductase
MPEELPGVVANWSTGCCVVGGGPAGLMLGYLLARAGVEVIVLEKHEDFFRDFRGDTIHPATTDVLAEAGLLEEFLRLPHTRLSELCVDVDGVTYPLADFRHLPTRCRFMAFMPQWDFLTFLAARAATYPNFRLAMRAEATELLREGDRVTGVLARTAAGEVAVRADLTVACDGRASVLRERAGLSVREFAVPLDVLWFRVPRAADAPQTLGRVGDGQLLITIDRGDYWQCGIPIDKDGFERVRAAGLAAFRSRVARAAPFLADGLTALDDWERVRLLTVRADRSRRWYLPGLLCIGDAAHAMSPLGAAGINYAIADAVATANRLAAPLRAGRVSVADLRAVQRRREPAVRRAQAIQARMTGQLPRLQRSGPPLGMLRLVGRLSPLRRLAGRFIGLGFRREHVRSPEAAAAKS